MTSWQDPRTGTGHPAGHQHRHGGHGLMMIACCIPILVIAIVL